MPLLGSFHFGAPLSPPWLRFDDCPVSCSCACGEMLLSPPQQASVERLPARTLPVPSCCFCPLASATFFSCHSLVWSPLGLLSVHAPSLLVLLPPAGFVTFSACRLASPPLFLSFSPLLPRSARLVFLFVLFCFFTLLFAPFQAACTALRFVFSPMRGHPIAFRLLSALAVWSALAPAPYSRQPPRT